MRCEIHAAVIYGCDLAPADLQPERFTTRTAVEKVKYPIALMQVGDFANDLRSRNSTNACIAAIDRHRQVIAQHKVSICCPRACRFLFCPNCRTILTWPSHRSRATTNRLNSIVLDVRIETNEADDVRASGNSSGLKRHSRTRRTDNHETITHTN